MYHNYRYRNRPLTKSEKRSFIYLMIFCGVLGIFFIISSAQSIMETPVETVATIKSTRTDYSSSHGHNRNDTSSTTWADIIYEVDGKTYENSVQLSSFPHEGSKMYIKYVKGHPEKIHESPLPLLAAIIFIVVWLSFMIFAVFHDAKTLGNNEVNTISAVNAVTEIEESAVNEMLEDENQSHTFISRLAVTITTIRIVATVIIVIMILIKLYEIFSLSM